MCFSYFLFIFMFLFNHRLVCLIQTSLFSLIFIPAFTKMVNKLSHSESSSMCPDSLATCFASSFVSFSFEPAPPLADVIGPHSTPSQVLFAYFVNVFIVISATKAARYKCGLSKLCPAGHFAFKIASGAASVVGPKMCLEDKLWVKRRISQTLNHPFHLLSH